MIQEPGREGDPDLCRRAQPQSCWCRRGTRPCGTGRSAPSWQSASAASAAGTAWRLSGGGRSVPESNVVQNQEGVTRSPPERQRSLDACSGHLLRKPQILNVLLAGAARAKSLHGVCRSNEASSVIGKGRDTGRKGRRSFRQERACEGVPMVCLPIWHWYMLRGDWLKSE